MSTVFIIHGAYGHPGENWFPWLKRELETLGYEVVVPTFPTPENQDEASWMEVIEGYREKLTDAIFVGHSLGVPLILRVAERYKISAAYLIAGFCTLPQNEFAPTMISFVDREFNWEAIKQNCPSFTIFHSDNDPYVPLDKAEELAKNLHTQVTQISGGGHFNEAAGYTKFPQLLKRMIEGSNT